MYGGTREVECHVCDVGYALSCILVIIVVLFYVIGYFAAFFMSPDWKLNLTSLVGS